MAPENGMIDCSLGDDGVANNGDTCTVTCNDGFTLNGDATRMCQITRRRINWLGDGAHCVKGMHGPLCLMQYGFSDALLHL